MSEEISVLKLMDGTTIVGKVSSSGDIIEIEHPIELVSTQLPFEGNLGEAVHLKPWVAIAEETIFTVERYNVITMSTLQQGFIKGYERMVEARYFEAPPAEVEKIEEPDLDIDTLTELADAVLKKQIH